MMNALHAFALLASIGLMGCAGTPIANPVSERSPTSAAPAAAPVAQSKVQQSTPQVRSQAIARSEPAMAADEAQTPMSSLSMPQAGARAVATLDAPADLWERIRRGYGMPDLSHDLVRDREQWYTARPDYIFRMTERSKKYLFHIVEELEVRNMPTELALLPFIESAFNPQAVSSAKAAGMWQFMPTTGRYFELKQNAFRDDRRDVLASTRAALDYLQKLHRMFGDWHLALAAYNWGEGSVGRAIKKNERAGLGTGYLDLSMPMETRMYVPKLQAIKNIVSDPKAFNSQLPLIENHPYFQTVTIRRDIDVALAAKLAEVPLSDFKALNPSINRPVIMAAGTPQILLPWDNAEVFQNNMESYAGGRLASWTVWVAPSTMRPGDAAKRVGMSETELRSVNNIPARGMLIKAGSSLLVPRGARVTHDVSEHVADNGQMSLAPELALKRTMVRAGKSDDVASMASKYKVNAGDLARWNKVGTSAKFKAGQQIVVYVAQTARPKATSTRSTRKQAPTQNRKQASTKRPAQVAKR